jgi:hypothetical protein
MRGYIEAVNVSGASEDLIVEHTSDDLVIVPGS